MDKGRGTEAARAPKWSNTQRSPPAWGLAPGIQGHQDPPVDVRDLSLPGSGPQKAGLMAVVLRVLLPRGPSPTEARHASMGTPPQHRLCTPSSGLTAWQGSSGDASLQRSPCPELPAMLHTMAFPTTHSWRKHATRGRSLPRRQPLVRLRIWGPAGVPGRICS